VIHDVSTVSALNFSAWLFYSFVVASGEKGTQELRTNGNCWVDVRDIAHAHVLALQKEEAANERLIVSAGSVVWQDWRKLHWKVHSPLFLN
jgi:nucleoside-diphosphate-sugar epimerase